MHQSQLINVLPRHILASLWASQETRISLSHLSTIMPASKPTPTTPVKHALRMSQPTMPVALTQSFLCSELPVRYIHILRLLSTLSPDALQSPIVRNVANAYLRDICTLIHPSLSVTSHRAFCDVLRRLRERQAASLIRLRYIFTATATPTCISLLDNINTIGFSVQLLIDQHLSWSTNEGNHVQKVCAVDIAKQAVNDAHEACSTAFGMEAPRIQVVEYMRHPNRQNKLELDFIPSVLYRILYESSLTALRARISQDKDTQLRSTWFQQKMQQFRKSEPTVLHVFGGPTSVGFRLNSSVPIPPSYLNPDIPRDPIGIPTCATVLRSTSPDSILDKYEQDSEQLVWDVMSGWRAAKILASHWGGNLDYVSVEGLGSSVYLALDRDTSLLERYPSRSLSSAHRLLRHHGRISAAAAAATASPLTLQAASIQLDTFLNAIANTPQHAGFRPVHHHDHHHSVSLSAAAGSA